MTAVAMDTRATSAGWTIVTPCHDWSGAEMGARLREEMEILVSNGHFHLVVDLQGVERVGLTTLALLVGMNRRAVLSGGRVSVVHDRGGVRRAFHTTGLHRVLALYDDLSSALAADIQG